MGTLKPQSNGPLYTNTVIGTLAVDGWAVTFGTARTAPPSPLLAVPNVTAHPSTASVPTSYYSTWRQNCLCPLKPKGLTASLISQLSRQHWLANEDLHNNNVLFVVLSIVVIFLTNPLRHVVIIAFLGFSFRRCKCQSRLCPVQPNAYFPVNYRSGFYFAIKQRFIIAVQPQLVVLLTIIHSVSQKKTTPLDIR